MTLYHLKSQFQDQLRPISGTLVHMGVRANQVTITAMLLSAGSAYLIAHIDNTDATKISTSRQMWFILPLSLFGRMALNAIDGMMAREHGQASALGAVLNESGDIIADSLLIASLRPHLALITQPRIFYNYRSKPNTQLNCLNILSFSTECIAIAATSLTGQRANHGPLGKSDRALELGTIGLLAGLGLPVHRYTQPLLLINQLLLIKTCLNRLYFMAQYGFNSAHPAPQLRSAGTLDKRLNHKIKQAVAITISKDEIMTTSKKNNAEDLQNTDKQNSHLKSTTSTDADIEDTSTKTIITEQSCYNAYDGTAIYYRYWLTKPLNEVHNTAIDYPTSSASSRQLKQVILLHRGHEHSGRLTELGRRYAEAGYQVFAWDARGNGRSGGIKDHAESVTQLERDLDGFVRLVSSKTGIGIEDTIIVASSIGAVLAAAWVHDYAPTIRGMILGTPAIRIRLYIPLAIPALKIARKFGFMSRVSSYVKAQVLTHDKEAQQAYNNDPLISGAISSDLLIDTHATGQRILDDAGAITTPTFVLCAGKDYVVDKQAERAFYEKLATPIKRWQLYPDSFHAIFHETNKDDIISDCIDFSDSLFDAPIQTVDLSQAHINSVSKDRVDRLAIKPFNPNFAMTRFAMQKFGHVSDAIATGLEHGFDSGSSLDKVYANTPHGKNAVGKAIDKFYLSNIGWQGIRIRREHLIELASRAIEALVADDSNSLQDSHSLNKDQAIKLLDIASGNGYYVFDLLTKFDNLKAELRDYDTHNVTVMREKALRLDMVQRVTCIQKDAFDSDSYLLNSLKTDGLKTDSVKVKDIPSKIDTNPSDVPRNKIADSELFDIAIASGVFELFSDNTLVSTALTGIFESLDDGGYFIYTNQPWHPEQEFISKALNNHRGTNWVMRCRSQLEMDQLVAQAGFEKFDMRIDRFGIFTVSVAKKPNHNRPQLAAIAQSNNKPLKTPSSNKTSHNNSH